MRKFFLIPLLACFSCVMAWAENPTTAADLQAAVDGATSGTSTTITLGGDIDGGTLSTANTQVLNIPSGKVIVLDLNGHNITAALNTGDKNKVNDYRYMSVINIVSGASLTIKDSKPNGVAGEIKNTNAGGNGFTRTVINSGTLNLQKCIITSRKHMGLYSSGTLTIGDENYINQNNEDVIVRSIEGTGIAAGDNDGVAIDLRGSATIYSGTLSSPSHPALFLVSPATANIYGGILDGASSAGALGLAYGDPNDVKIYGGTYSSDPSACVAQGYLAEYDSNTEKYIVSKINDPINYNVSSVSEMEEALSHISSTQPIIMTLTGNVILSSSLTLPHSSELVIPEEYTFTVADGGLFVNEGVTRANGTIAIQGTGYFSKPASVVYGENGSMSIAGYSMSDVDNVVQYAISTPMQLQYLAYLVLQDEYEDKTWNITLNTDLDMPASVNFEPIIKMQATFDGQNHAINGFYIHSDMTNASLFETFKGTVKNLTMNDVDINSVSGGAAGLCQLLKVGSIIENVTLHGALVSTNGGASGFVTTCEQISSDETGSEMKNQETDYIWFVNCTNDLDCITTSAYNCGGFIGTVSGALGTFGFYNCTNNGNITGNNAGKLIGHGSGTTTAAEIVAFTNTGSVDLLSGTNVPLCGIQNMLGAASINLQLTSEYSDEYDPAKYIAVWDATNQKYVAKLKATLENNAATTTNWALSTTWTENAGSTYDVVPTEGDNVTINNSGTVEVQSGTNAVAKSVSVADSKSLTIKTGGTLTIGEGGLTIASNATVTVEQGAKLIVGQAGVTNNGGTLAVQATEAGGTGVVLFDPNAAVAKTRVAASVQLTPDAHFVSGETYLHRYIGIPLYFGGSEAFSYADNWTELADGANPIFKEWNAMNGWVGLTSWAQLVPFKGFATSNTSTSSKTYTFKGNLVGNGNASFEPEYGFNMFANSYTAPIQIQTLLNGFDENVNLTIYMFKDDVVKSVSKSAFNGYEDPEFTSIPALQAFFIYKEDNGASPTETLNYANSVFNNSYANGALYAPARQETPDFNRVRINVTAANGKSDAAYLIEADEFTADFDNGYDAVKYMNEGLNFYATTAHGRQSSTYSDAMVGTLMGIQAAAGTYTMSFDKVMGENYQIRDLKTNAVVDMVEGATYTFTTTGNEDARFEVIAVAKTPTAIDNVNAANLFVNNNTLFVANNEANAAINIYASNGQLVLSENATTVDLSGLATGVYTVRVANQTLKFVK